jgi:site-specific recombinase XerD
MRLKPKYVNAWVDKRYGGAKPRFYFRKRGQKQIPLPGILGSVEFNEAYAAALAGSHNNVITSIGAKRIRAGSIGALVIAYFNSPEFLALSAATQRTYRGILEPFTAEHGDKPLALLNREHIKSMLAKRVSKPAAANHWLRLIKALMKFAVREGLRNDDPAMLVDYLKRKAGEYHTWSEDEIARYEARHPVGSKARLALALGLYTAQRRSDVVKMGRQHVHGGTVRVRQQKTGTMVPIPVHPALAAILDAIEVHDNIMHHPQQLTFLVTQYGKPFTAAGFGGWFRERCDEAGLPKQCAFHGLRKAACRRLAEAGCSANVIASISGHRSLREVEVYTRAAS